ncbi:MAG TPA: alpha/beta hydrolase, partial [Methylophilaceae bacterium]|nr:alpha/beta hydrolase [Methylophilaceae bacterium]
GLDGVTLVGESIGAVLALTVAATLPEKIRRVVAVNPYDYETRYADGIRRGNFLANFILGNFAIPIQGAIFAALENKLLLGMIMRGGLHSKSAMPDALLSEFNRVGRRRGYRYVERNVLAHWRSWRDARMLYAGVRASVTLVYGSNDWSTPEERARTAAALGGIQILTVEDTGHFGFVDRPQRMAEIVLAD